MNLSSKFLRAQQATCFMFLLAPPVPQVHGHQRRVDLGRCWAHVGFVSQQRNKELRKLWSYLRIDGNFPILLSKVRHYLYPGTYENHLWVEEKALLSWDVFWDGEVLHLSCWSTFCPLTHRVLSPSSKAVCSANIFEKVVHDMQKCCGNYLSTCSFPKFYTNAYPNYTRKGISEFVWGL